MGRQETSPVLRRWSLEVIWTFNLMKIHSNEELVQSMNDGTYMEPSHIHSIQELRVSSGILPTNF